MDSRAEGRLDATRKTSATDEGDGARRARVPLVLFVLAAFLAAFGAGMYVEATKRFPSGLIRSAYKTLVVNLDFAGIGSWKQDPAAPHVVPRSLARDCVPVAAGLRDQLAKDFRMRMLSCPAAHIAPAEAAASRIEFLASDALIDPVLVKGESGTFLDHCPAPWGCLAVEYSRSGAVSRVWPFRPEEIARANIVAESDYPYEHPVGWSFLDFGTYRISPYPNGDLLVVFTFPHTSYPYSGGVARVSPDGRPRWYRKDYSHHDGHVISDDLALVSGLRLDRSHLAREVPTGSGRVVELQCHRGEIMEDTVNLMGGNGKLLEQIPILDAIVESPFATTLVGPQDSCDPTHLNFVHMLGADAGGAEGIAPGDLVVSLRNLNAFAILDEDDRRLKKLVRGSFRQQHGVRHLDNARFIMFDNLGTDGVHGPSRLLIVDLATGKETTVFPNDATPLHLRDWFSYRSGTVDVSLDGRRALVADVQGARAFEIRLADGRVLNVFRQVHDLSKLPGLPEALTKTPWFFRFHSIQYANKWAKR